MRLDRPSYATVLLGPPQFLRNGESVQFPTRKSLAICIYLAVQPGVTVERQRLCGLLWGDFEGEAARVSLRKALSLISTNEATGSFIDRGRGWVRCAVDPACSDLAVFIDLITQGTESGYREAIRMWRGEPLEGAEIGEPAFDDWVREFRTTTTSQILRHLNDRLDTIAEEAASRSKVIALCELIVRIDPAEVPASARLVKLFAETGDPAAAVRRLRLLKAALDDLDIPLPPQIAAFERSLRSAALGEVPDTFAPAPFNGIPTVILKRPAGLPPMPDAYSHIHSEVMCQLTRFRSLRCFEPLPDETDPHDIETGKKPRSIQLDGGLEHDYRILLWNEPNARALYLRCVNSHRQNTVACIRLGYDELEDRELANLRIASAINAIERDILNDDAPHPNSPFARWLTAYNEMQKFNVRSDDLASEILRSLVDDARGSRLSLVHSSLAAIFLKHNMYYPGPQASKTDYAQARSQSQIALNLDMQAPFNHAISGWMSIQDGQYERARGEFEYALALNPHSSRVLISSAEAFALCGDLAEAKRLAERAMDMSGRLAPAYFHSYLANIAYLDGDLDQCTRRLQRAPQNGHTLLLAIAAHQERNDLDEVAGARGRFEEELRQTERVDGVDHTALSQWVVTANMMRDEVTRRRMFGALERAGLPVAQDV